MLAKHLTKVFRRPGQPDYPAVKDVSFEMQAGESLAIVGESGSGKSTLARLIARLLEPTSGAVYLAGEDITKANGAQIRAIYRTLQMVFQNPQESFDPRRTLGDGVGESLRNEGLSRWEAARQTAELLERCGLPAAFARRYPHEVSGGQCQRAAIARALARNPKLLICDEATSALDVTIQAQIIDLLLEIQREKHMALFFICHDLALVQQTCHRVCVMYRGEIIEQGLTETILTRPQMPYTQTLLDSVWPF